MYNAPDSLRLRPGQLARAVPTARPATIMTAPGRVATSASTPYTTATVTPSAALSPTAPNAHAAAPSRGPQPAMFAGTAEASSTTSASGSSWFIRSPGDFGQHGRQLARGLRPVRESVSPRPRRRAEPLALPGVTEPATQRLPESLRVAGRDQQAR